MNDKNIKGRIFSSPQRKAFVAAFCIVILFATGYAIGVLANINVYMPRKAVAVVETVTTTAPTTTAPTTTEPTTVPTTLPPETTTTEPTTTEAVEEDECCLAGLCDTIKGLLGTVFPCLAEE